jgi:hypothetical protein
MPAIPDHTSIGMRIEGHRAYLRPMPWAAPVTRSSSPARDKVIWNMAAADFDSVLRVHVRGTWLATRAAAIRWRARARAGETFTGRIINTTSGAGLTGNFGQSSYSGWQEATTISADGKRWDADTLGVRMATDIFRTRAPGLR